MKKIGLLIVCLMTLFSLKAQDDVSFKVICKKQVVVGEQFQVSYELSGDGKNFEAPNFNNFEIVGGPFSSSSSSVQIVNGSVTRTNTHTYSFYLRAIKEGKYTIPAATIYVNKQKVKKMQLQTNYYSVVAGGSASNGAATNTKDVFLEAVPNKMSAYLGEQIILTYKIYYTIPISNLRISTRGPTTACWTS